MVNRLEELDSPSDSEQLLPFPSLPEERADTPGGLQQDALELDAQEDSEADPSGPRRDNKKRKHSPSAGGSTTPRSPALHENDTAGVAPLPLFVPHTATLPASNYEFYSTRYHPISKNGYRYVTCGASPTPSLPIGVAYYRLVESVPQSVRFSWEDRSPFVLISDDASAITAEKGWRGAKGNVPLREGNWYWEVKVNRGGGDGSKELGGDGEGSWVRAGVGRRESPNNAPVGKDGYSYAYRDKTGEAITLSRPKPYGTSFGTDSTIGIYISLPPRPTIDPTDRQDPNRIVRKRVAIRFKGQLYYESLEYPSSKEMDDLCIDPATKTKVVAEQKKAAPGTKAPPPVEALGPAPRPLPILKNARIAFFVDGKCQGVAFEDIYDFAPLRTHPGQRSERKKADPRTNWHDDGTMGYYPFVSVFGGGIASINPGPNFEFPPPDNIEAALRASSNPPSNEEVAFSRKEEGSTKDWRALSERYPEYLAEQSVLDDLDEVEAVRAFHVRQAKEAEKEAMEGEGGGGGESGSATPNGTTLTTTVPVLKNGKVVTIGTRLEELGVVKKEDVVTVGSPISLSPNPGASRNGTPTLLKRDDGMEVDGGD